MTEKGDERFDFGKAFRTWELQKGFPVIHVSYKDSKFEITQQRFFVTKKETSTDSSSWYIPLNFAIESSPMFDDTSFTNYFVNGENLHLIDVPAQYDASQWFVFNKQQLGYYRVNYDFENWHALMVTLNSDDYHKIHVLNRAQLVDDVLNFAVGGYEDYELAFGIMSYLERETEFAPWSAADVFLDRFYRKVGPWNVDLNVSTKFNQLQFNFMFLKFFLDLCSLSVGQFLRPLQSSSRQPNSRGRSL
jgi:aminopeptidase N